MRNFLFLAVFLGQCVGAPPTPKALSERDENKLMKLQLEYIALEKQATPMTDRMKALSAQWEAEEARIRKEQKVPVNCRINPERKWECKDPKQAEATPAKK